MSRIIRKVAVLGSGVMGTGIAAHFANTGHQVLLLDIVPFDLTDEEKLHKANRNRLVNQNLMAAVKAKKLNAFYDKEFASRIQTGNFDDDLEKISDCDWILEVVVERLDIKRQVFEKVEKYRRKGSLVTSNTSGIPIHLMAEGSSEDFKAHFCGTHFFNPPRYLRLLEIIPIKETKPEVLAFLMHYGDVILGKQTVLCKDTPGFIANRVGVYAMAKTFQLTKKYGLTIEEVDKLSGPASGKPKTGTFRLGDLVGHDTTAKVIQGLKQNCPNDEQSDVFVIPPFFHHILDNKWFGDKSGQGFYRSEFDKDGKRKIFALDLDSLEYVEQRTVNLASLDEAKRIEKLEDRIRSLFDHEDKGGKFIRESLLSLFAYVSNRIPEISDELFNIDAAIKAGFAWELGPFEHWDIIGVEKALKLATEAGYQVADWVSEMLESGADRFYKKDQGNLLYYHIPSKKYRPVSGSDGFIVLDHYRENAPVFKNNGATVHDIGDGVLCLEFRTKMNTIGGEVIEALNKAIDIAESGDWKGLVIGNNSTHFSVGANLAVVGMAAVQGQFDMLEQAVKAFQDVNMRIRYSGIPVIAATQGYVFGGGCEIAMHCDGVAAAAESYIGLVEFGVGLLPGAGGTKEFALRLSDELYDGDVAIPRLLERFTTIAMAKVGTSAFEAYQLGYLQEGRDHVIPNTSRAIASAKEMVLSQSESYVQPIPRDDIYVLGQSGLGALYVAAASLKYGNYASEHDVKIARKMAWVLCGGDLSAPQKVSEQYLLDLEREAFLSLLKEQKTLERIQHMLTTNKPLRN